MSVDPEPAGEIRRILVATDLSAEALAAVRLAGELGRRLGAAITVLYVVEDHLPPILVGVSEAERREILERHRHHASRALETHVAEPLAEVRIETRAVVGSPAHEIVALAEKDGFDLIVVASRGYGPLRQLLLGSTAERVLHHAPCPVLLVPTGNRRRVLG